MLDLPSLQANGGDYHWLHVFRASRMALHPAKLVLAAAGLCSTFIIGTGLDFLWVSAGGGLHSTAVATSPLIVAAAPDDSPRGLFELFARHEKHCLDQALKAARKLNFTGHLGDVWGDLHNRGGQALWPDVGRGYGALAFAMAMAQGAFWLLTRHWLYSLLFGLLTLTAWSLFGGAICRIAALQYARDEELTAREALRYSRSKFNQFFLAPLVPLLVVLMIGLSLYVGGWLMRIPALGSIFGGLLFGLALLAGGVMALTIVLTSGGFSLMWPTVAVEGIDVTDALSRSFSYVFERTERAVAYAFLAILYGSLVWMVIKIFAFLLAYGTHGFVSNAYPELNNMWQDPPTYDRLFAVPESSDHIKGPVARTITFPLIRVWLTVAGFLLYGYLISYYFTGSTIIYFLLRYKVDETELDDVYLEKPEPSDALPAASSGGQ